MCGSSLMATGLAVAPGSALVAGSALAASEGPCPRAIRKEAEALKPEFGGRVTAVCFFRAIFQSQGYEKQDVIYRQK